MVKVKIPKPYQTWLFTLLAVCWFSGTGFFILKMWFMVEGDYGPVKHPWQFPSLQIHGAAAFLMMITFGFMLGSHVPASWKVRPLRKLGIALVAMPTFLIITAYLLYYIAQDDIREIIGYAHLAVGVCLPGILVAHIVARKKRKKKKLPLAY